MNKDYEELELEGKRHIKERYDDNDLIRNEFDYDIIEKDKLRKKSDNGIFYNTLSWVDENYNKCLIAVVSFIIGIFGGKYLL